MPNERSHDALHLQDNGLDRVLPVPSRQEVEKPVKYRRYKYGDGGARFYFMENGVERLLADTYNAAATERVAAALGAKEAVA